jgi:hypothetical protein
VSIYLWRVQLPKVKDPDVELIWNSIQGSSPYSTCSGIWGPDACTACVYEPYGIDRSSGGHSANPVEKLVCILLLHFRIACISNGLRGSEAADVPFEGVNGGVFKEVLNTASSEPTLRTGESRITHVLYQPHCDIRDSSHAMQIARHAPKQCMSSSSDMDMSLKHPVSERTIARAARDRYKTEQRLEYTSIVQVYMAEWIELSVILMRTRSGSSLRLKLQKTSKVGWPIYKVSLTRRISATTHDICLDRCNTKPLHRPCVDWVHRQTALTALEIPRFDIVVIFKDETMVSYLAYLLGHSLVIVCPLVNADGIGWSRIWDKEH